MRWFSLTILLLCPMICEAQTAVIVGKTEYEQGEKIVLESTGSDADSVAWLTLDEGVQYQQFGNTLAVWAKPGRRSVVLIAAKIVDGKVQMGTAQHVFTVSGTVPNPGPDPQPDPQPQPEPDPPQPDLTGFAKNAYDVVMGQQRKAGETTQLAQSFRAIAGRAAGLQTMTLAQIEAESIKALLAMAATDEAKQRWTPFKDWFAGVMQSNATTREKAIELLNEISDGVEAAPVGAVRSSAPPSNTGSIADEMRNLREKLQGLNREIGQ